MDNIIFHIDVNNAFLSWSAIDLLNKGYKYDIRNSYAVIGGDEKTRNGIVLAKSIPCKKLGIVSAETLYSARRKCKVLKVYPPNYQFYSKMSNSLFTLLNKYTPDIEIASIDECYLDYGKVKKMYGDEISFAYKLKDEIKEKLGFTVNIGIANNKLCAKMASDFSKPDKVHTLYAKEVKEKMYPLPIGDLFGIGKKTNEKLISLGIKTIGDLANYNIDQLTKYFKNQAKAMVLSAQGINDDIVSKDEWIPKGIGNEITLIKDTNNRQELYNSLFLISENVALRLRKQKKYAYTVVVTIKDDTFKRKSHQKRLKNATNITSEIYEISKDVFNEMWEYDKIRLIGIRLDNLVPYKEHQVSLFEESIKEEKESKLDKVVDEIKEKYGYKAINKASLSRSVNSKALVDNK